MLFRKRIRSRLMAPKAVDSIIISNEPTEANNLARQMHLLSSGLKSIRWRRNVFLVVNHSKRIHKRINQIREKLKSIPSDIITFIPSARCLFDNFQVIYREIIGLNASTSGYMYLPVLKSTACKGLPRAYVIAKKMIDLCEGHLDEENIASMIRYYQEVNPLTGRELQVLPEMIVLSLLEHIIDVTKDVTRVIKTKTQADSFVKNNILVKQNYIDISPLLVENDEYKHNICYHSHIVYLLKNMTVAQEQIQQYISFHFGEDSLSQVDIYMEEVKRGALLESSIRNPIISLRKINEINNDELFERISLVEEVLNKDPDDVYGKMDGESRAFYRSVIEKLSKKHNICETDIANNAQKLATEGHEELNHAHHVGTYIVGKGKKLLKKRLLSNKSQPVTDRKINLKGISYFLVGTVIVLAIYYLLILAIKGSGYGNMTGYIAAFLVAGTPMFVGISLKITNTIMTRSIPSNVLPAMDYTNGIPQDARTFVVMPVIVSSKEQGLEYLSRLHKHYMANKQDNLHFALLVDLIDSSEKDAPDDEIIYQAIMSQVNDLNRAHPLPYRKFSLFIRERRWNPSEGCFMCWERKRGKLEEFNRLLNGKDVNRTSFSKIVCDKEILEEFKYVITLDADSDLVYDNACKLVGTIDHPLNRACIDPVKKTVKEGYAIIQPKVANHMLGKNNSLFQRIYSGRTGIASYSQITSDIYQDIFGEGIFIGKGIYNVKVFHSILHDLIPENRVLSHDLLESCYVKTAFSSNANIIESFPSTYISYAKRENRWIRGDWQLIPWLFKRNLSALSKWKILDDIRSSLVPISKLLIIIINLFTFPDIYWLWICIITIPLVLDLLLIFLNVLFYKVRRRGYVLLYRALLKEISLIISRFFFDVVFIPYGAYNSMAAIIRTLYRLIISKKNLLMWSSAGNVEKADVNTLKHYFVYMCHTIIPSIIVLISITITNIPIPGMILHGGLALAWGLSYYIAYRMSLFDEKSLSDKYQDRENILSDTTRRIWRFSRDFTTPENNWLCPDNYQLGSKEKTAYRTSPTNIGLQFLTILSARDFGYETIGSTLNYIENLLYTISVLPKWRGHLFNWYNTQTLDLLNPHYISTVDSGNFFAHLIAVKNGLLELKNRPILSKRLVDELANLLKATNVKIEFKNDYRKISDFINDILDISHTLSKRDDLNDSRDLEDFTRLAGLIAAEVEELAIGKYAFDEGITLSDLALNNNASAKKLIDSIVHLSETMKEMISRANFRELFNEKRKLFYVGFNATSQSYDNSCYDLMASEAMLVSLLAIAKGDVSVKHWKRLGRPITIINGYPAHVSWSGTMFEYLMPQLVVREFDGSVFEDSSRAAVIQQIKYANNHNIPWGISESQYYRFDTNHNYQYRAFGVPKIRLQPVYNGMQVITPYASILALEYNPPKVLDNLKKIMDMGAYGKYGFYEAIDFSVPDPVTLTKYCIVKSFMAHHQGMSMVAINNYLNNGIMRQRFHSEPIIKAIETLLEEKNYEYFISSSKRGYHINLKERESPADENVHTRHVKAINLSVPAVLYLSNGSYSLLTTSDGDGFSSFKDKILYRWRPDIYADTGQYIYIRDIDTGRYWSVSHKPTRQKADDYEVIFHPSKAEYLRRDGDISTSTVVTISPDLNLELRVISIKNLARERRNIEITSYMEVVADSYRSESGHPAFNKLFIENEFIDKHSALITRRRSGDTTEGPYVMHKLSTEHTLSKSIEYECSRLIFIGRNNTLRNPCVMSEGMPLSNNTDFSGDPISSLRACISIEPGEEATITYITGMFESKEELLRVSNEFSSYHTIENTIETFNQQTKIELKYLNMTGNMLRAFQNIISQIYYPTMYYRGPVERVRRNWKDKSTLWKFGISGDEPIMLLMVSSVDEMKLVKDVLRLYEYMGINMVKADLVILAEGKYGYINELTDMLNTMTSSLRIYDSAKESSGIYIIHSYQLNPAEMDLIQTVASVVFTSKTGIYFRNVSSAY